MDDRLNEATAYVRVLHKEAGKAYEFVAFAETSPLRPLVVNVVKDEREGGKIHLLSRNGYRVQRRQMQPLAPGMQSDIELWLMRKRVELETQAAQLTINGARSISITPEGIVT